MRFIEFDGRNWRLSELARSHGLTPGTLHGRLARFPATSTGIARALATGIQTREQAGRAGAKKSPWRYPGA